MITETYDEFTAGMLDSISRAGASDEVTKKLARFAAHLIIQDWFTIVTERHRLASMELFATGRPALTGYDTLEEKFKAAIAGAGEAAQWENDANKRHAQLTNIKAMIAELPWSSLNAILEANHSSDVATRLSNLRDYVNSL